MRGNFDGQGKMARWLVFAVMGLLIDGCATAPHGAGALGAWSGRTVVILGEHQDAAVAQQYAEHYQARVVYTPSRGGIADAVSSSLRATLGPSRAMQHLIQELRSLNGTSGTWTIVVPRVAEDYFLATLQHMEGGSLSQTHGIVWLVDSAGNAAMEQAVQRVSNGAMTVRAQTREATR